MSSNDTIDLNNRKIFRDMVGWFDVTVLIDAAKRSIVSALFGSYADRRLMNAALEDISCSKSGTNYRTDFRDTLTTTGKNEIWVDYVSDLGDGFNSTYAIAHLIGMKELPLPNGTTLPRAQVLIMGGDEVYPNPTRNEYKTRMEMPYQYAHPDTEPGVSAEDSKKTHPLLFMIPGNHDWYDGLTLFLAKFCRRDGAKLGNWRLHQTRSYFASRISEDWWIWGSDTQLAEDVDQPQADYFIDIAKRMAQETPNAKVILCSSVPTWIKADDETESHQLAFGMGVDYIATKILLDHCPKAKIYTVLSGDQHHYSRYIDEKSGINFITSGGGGAFLHPTHHLKDDIKNINWRKSWTPLKLAQRDASFVSPGEDKAACFPDRSTSRSLAWGNLKFPLINKQFVYTLGGAYALLSLLLSSSIDLSVDPSKRYIDFLTSPISWLVWVLLMVGVSLQADFSNSSHWAKKICSKFSFPSDKWIAATVHGTLHFFWLSLLFCVLPNVNQALSLVTKVHVSPEWGFVFFLLEMGLLGGFFGGFIWGTYLACSSYFFAKHYNDSFSAMRLESFKNFLRMHINGDKLTIYPIGVEKVPGRKGWRVNDNHSKGNSDKPVILPVTAIEYRLIEAPIVIS